MRTIIIGDIHGCSSALDVLLAQINPVPGKDRLVFLGDLFDRGPDSYSIFEKIKLLAENFGEGFILMLGNHEDYLLKSRLTKMEQKIWERVGRQATV